MLLFAATDGVYYRMIHNPVRDLTPLPACHRNVLNCAFNLSERLIVSKRTPTPLRVMSIASSYVTLKPRRTLRFMIATSRRLLQGSDAMIENSKQF
jgi:hypothetical protein